MPAIHDPFGYDLYMQTYYIHIHSHTHTHTHMRMLYTVFIMGDHIHNVMHLCIKGQSCALCTYLYIGPTLHAGYGNVLTVQTKGCSCGVATVGKRGTV